MFAETNAHVSALLQNTKEQENVSPVVEYFATWRQFLSNNASENTDLSFVNKEEWKVVVLGILKLHFKRHTI